jgi:TetR/AcrR family transcriptional regulator
MSGVARRQQFIDAALGLFSTSGFRGTSTRAIAEAAGVSEALLFRHFPTKADLYSAILEQKARETGFATHIETLRGWAGRGDDWALVQHVVSLILASYRRDPEFERLMLYAALERHELATASRQMFGVPTFTLLRDYVVERQRAGVFRPGDPGLIVFALIALPVYFSMVHRLLGMQLAAAPDSAASDLFTQVVLDGVRVHADDLNPRLAQGDGREILNRGKRQASKPRSRRRGQ